MTEPEELDDEAHAIMDPPPGRASMTLDELRASIRPMSVLERVEAHALGREEMTSTELQAAKLFLAKTQADLKAVEVTGKDGGSIQVVGRIELVPLT